MNLYWEIFYSINEYVREKPLLDGLIVFIARHLPTILILVSCCVILVKIIPKNILEDIQKRKITHILLISFSAILASSVLFFRRYVFGITSVPREESNGWAGRMIRYSYIWTTSNITHFRPYVRFLTDISIAPTATLMVAYIIKVATGELRPFEVLPRIVPLFEIGGGHSFPSGHAAFFASIAVVFLVHYPRLGAIYTVFALMIGFARMASGVHYPFDIFAGYIVGVFVTYVVMRINHKKIPTIFLKEITILP
ncbi:MAG: phosphatase PAP2 family protein [Candidatus Pacebacteria bacterium]|nr:phosphatase PAP2 family protein [Candidatus Paceibacterota bacterium]